MTRAAKSIVLSNYSNSVLLCCGTTPLGSFWRDCPFIGTCISPFVCVAVPCFKMFGRYYDTTWLSKLCFGLVLRTLSLQGPDYLNGKEQDMCKHIVPRRANCSVLICLYKRYFIIYSLVSFLTLLSYPPRPIGQMLFSRFSSIMYSKCTFCVSSFPYSR